jgi:hypothetical protein
MNWGLGWGLQRASGEDMLWHWGDNGVFQAFAMAPRQRGLGLVAMANSKSGRALWRTSRGACSEPASRPSNG